VERGIGVGSVNEHIGIDDQQLPVLHRLVQCAAVSDVYESTAAVEARQGRKFAS